MTDRGHTDPAAQYVDRLAGYDQRLQMLERSHVHEPQTPVGVVADWPGPTVPNLWHLCDGASLLAAAYPDLFAVVGYTWGGSGASFNLPDLRSRVTVGTGPGPGLTNRALAAKGGAETVAITAAQTGSHGHGYSFTTSNDGSDHSHTIGGNSGNATGAHSHPFTTGADTPAHTHPYTTPGPENQAVVAAGGIFTQRATPNNAQSATPNVTHTHSGNTGSDAQPHQHGLPAATGGENLPHQHTGSGTTDGGTTASAAHENMPPYAAVQKIIKVLPDTAANFTALTIIERTR